MPDSLDTRFPQGRRVVLYPSGASGTVAWAKPELIAVDQDDGPRRLVSTEVLERMPGCVRLVSNLVRESVGADHPRGNS